MRKIQTSKAIYRELKEAKDLYSENDVRIRRLIEKCKKAKKTLRSQQRQDAAKKRNNTFEQRASKAGHGNILVDNILLTEDNDVRSDWKTYFDQLGTPVNDPSFDQQYLDKTESSMMLN